MPELPEVETIKRVLEPQVKGLEISDITANRTDIIAYPSAQRLKARSGWGIGFVPDASSRFFCAWKRLTFTWKKGRILVKYDAGVLGASAFLKSVVFRAFAVNVKTIAPTQKLCQSGHAIWCERSEFLSFEKFLLPDC